MDRLAIYTRRRIHDSSYRLMQRLRNDGVPCFRITPERNYSNTGLYKGRMELRQGDVVFYWGCSQTPEYTVPAPISQLNSPGAVAQFSDKLAAFVALEGLGVPVIEWSQREDTAMGWQSRVFVRHRLVGRSGQGIEVWSPDEDNPLPTARLYTRCYRGRNVREYRALVFRGNVIHLMQKRRRSGVGTGRGMADLVRTHGNGWVYASNNVDIHPRTRGCASDAALALFNAPTKLDFGGIDFFGDLYTGDFKVCEVNTAPGITSPSSLTAVADSLSTYTR